MPTKPQAPSEPRDRATAEQLAERHAYALQLRQLGVPPTLALARVANRFGVSTRTARRYLAHAADEIREDGVPSEADLIDSALSMSARVIANAMIDAAEAGDLTALGRLSRELRELKSAQRRGPELNDDELVTAARVQAAKDALDQQRQRSREDRAAGEDANA